MDTLCFEREARHRAAALEAVGRLPAGFTEHHYPLTLTERRELRRLSAAVMLAKDAATFCALVRGRRVPQHRLRGDYLRLAERAAA